MTFLAIDVGNTRLKWALYDRPHTQAHVLAQGAEFLENIETLAEGPWASLPVPDHMLGCVVAGDAVKRRVKNRWSCGKWRHSGWCRLQKKRV